MWWLASWTEPQGQLKSQAEHLVSSSAFWISSCRACAFGTDWTWPLNPLHICRRLTWKTDSLMTWNPNHKQWLDTCGPLLQDYLHHKLTQWYIYIYIISIWVLQQRYGFCFWMKPDKPAKKNIEDGHFSVTICLILRSHTTPLLCCELCQQGGNHNGLVRCHLTSDMHLWLSMRDWTAQNSKPPHLLFWLQLLLASVNGISKNYKTTELKHGETMWKPLFPCHGAIPQSLMT